MKSHLFALLNALILLVMPIIGCRSRVPMTDEQLSATRAAPIEYREVAFYGHDGNLLEVSPIGGKRIFVGRSMHWLLGPQDVHRIIINPNPEDKTHAIEQQAGCTGGAALGPAIVKAVGDAGAAASFGAALGDDGDTLRVNSTVDTNASATGGAGGHGGKGGEHGHKKGNKGKKGKKGDD